MSNFRVISSPGKPVDGCQSRHLTLRKGQGAKDRMSRGGMRIDARTHLFLHVEINDLSTKVCILSFEVLKRGCLLWWRSDRNQLAAARRVGLVHHHTDGLDSRYGLSYHVSKSCAKAYEPCGSLVGHHESSLKQAGV